MISLKSSEKELISKLKKSDAEALALLYSKHSRRVFALALYIVKDQNWSEDVVQEVFIQLWDNRDDIEEDKDIWLLLYIITKQKSLTKLRAIMRYEDHKQRHFRQLNTACHSLENEIYYKDLKNTLEAALNKLTPTQKMIFNLSRFDGLSHHEIADKLSISKNTVKNHMVVALKTLRVYLQDNQLLGLFIFLEFEFILDLI